MPTFPGKRLSNLLEKGREQRRSPNAGRTRQENNKIRRHCERFRDNLHHLDAITHSQLMPWFPVDDVVTDRDDDAIIDWRAVAENMKQDGYAIDGDGLLLDMQDPGIAASNRIEAVTVYRRGIGLDVQDYMIRKTLYSPFPCDEWGNLVLTLHQWRIIALAMIQTRVNWQWQEAVNTYARKNGLPDGYEWSYTAGWNLVLPGRPSRERQLQDITERQVWTGHIIYSIATTVSLNTQHTKPGCPE